MNEVSFLWNDLKCLVYLTKWCVCKHNSILVAKELRRNGGIQGFQPSLLMPIWLPAIVLTSEAVAYMIHDIWTLNASGFHVLVVFNLPLWHYTKVASIQWIGEHEVARANMYKDRTEIMRFSEELLDNNSSPGEWDSLETARKNLQTKVKTAKKIIASISSSICLSESSAGWNWQVEWQW